MNDQIIDGYRFVQTCPACPEQYDVFDEGAQVAYIRERHGYSYVECPDIDGERVFESDEGVVDLQLFAKLIRKWQKRKQQR